ncbi:hypothetical protein [Bacillus sp. FJAT-27225]|uniref:hypothetical protein n=1 Tax=Bacillus sp. FJAT-27225 TaxID=1743144 RepID=UPI001585D6A5|nr:hypothetical protein [Bacillus sp. FJAT-27225]
MYEDVYVIEKTMQLREQEYQMVRMIGTEIPFANKSPFYCSVPIFKQLTVCNCN